MSLVFDGIVISIETMLNFSVYRKFWPTPFFPLGKMFSMIFHVFRMEFSDARYIEKSRFGFAIDQ